MFGLPPIGMTSVAGIEPNVRNNDQEQMSALQKLYASVAAHNRTPNGRVARGFDQFGPQPTGPVAPMLPAPPTPAPVDMGSPASPPPPALSAAAMAPAVTPSAQAVPLPKARPNIATEPQQEPMGFFQRNSAMMRDPSSGAFIDPVNAERAQASGPDVINKLMSYFHKKDDPSNT